MLVQNKDQIFRCLRDHGAQINAFGVRRVGLFGSFLRGEHGPDSDIDLLVEFRSGRKTFDSFMGLAFMLEDILGRKVDLVTPESLSPYIGPKILADVEYDVID